MLISTFLLEDQSDIRDALIIGMQQHAPVRFVGIADSEASAKKWLSANDSQWELAIVDLCLIKGSGLNVLKNCRLRSSRQKVVVFTSCTEEHLLSRCRELGADAVFDKGQDVEKLVAFCKRHAANLVAQHRHGPRDEVYNVTAGAIYDET